MNADEESTANAMRIELGATAGIAVCFLVLRMLAVSHWDWHVVAAISDTFDFSDAFPIAFGTVAGQPLLTGILVVVLLPLTLMRVVWPVEAYRGYLNVSTLLTLVVLIVIMVTISFTFGNLWTLVGALAFCAVIVIVRVIFRHGRLHDAIVSLTKRTALIAGVGVLVLAAVNDAPWTSRESITVDDGVIDGYVLEAESGFLHILTDEREVIIVPDATVRDRRLVG